jgi:hypothetical protein
MVTAQAGTESPQFMRPDIRLQPHKMPPGTQLPDTESIPILSAPDQTIDLPPGYTEHHVPAPDRRAKPVGGIEATTPAPQTIPPVRRPPAKDIRIQPTIMLVAPDSGTKWETTEQVQVSWRTINIPEGEYLSVELFNHNGTKRIEYIGNSNSGRLDWTIPASIYKWPGNYRIRVATLDNRVEKISDMFHIGLKTVQRTVNIKAATVNKVITRVDYPGQKNIFESAVDPATYGIGSGQNWDTGMEPPTPDPGPHKMRVGYERFHKEPVRWSWIYRSHVKAHVHAHKDHGFLISATLHYPRISGDEIEERFCVLTQEWDGDPNALFTIPCDIERIGPWKHDVTSHVRRWFSYPQTNYGFLFFGRDESLDFDTRYRGAATYGDVRLVLEFESPL